MPDRRSCLELLLFFISSLFAAVHIARRYRQSLASFLADKEYNQIPAGARLIALANNPARGSMTHADQVTYSDQPVPQRPS